MASSKWTRIYACRHGYFQRHENPRLHVVRVHTLLFNVGSLRTHPIQVWLASKSFSRPRLAMSSHFAPFWNEGDTRTLQQCFSITQASTLSAEILYIAELPKKSIHLLLYLMMNVARLRFSPCSTEPARQRYIDYKLSDRVHHVNPRPSLFVDRVVKDRCDHLVMPSIVYHCTCTQSFTGHLSCSGES